MPAIEAVCDSGFPGRWSILLTFTDLMAVGLTPAFRGGHDFGKIWGLLKFIRCYFTCRFSGSIHHRMPLRGEFMPLLFGDEVGCVFGAFLATDRFLMIFSR
jgi:hypothetical protein